MVNTFPVGRWPRYGQDEIEAVSRVLKSGNTNYWTGMECRKFEEEFASYHGVKHAIALANGTLALELALRALQIGEGDEVIVTPRSFIASASCVVQAGARPVFAEVDRDSQNITARTVERQITSRTKAIIPVHLAGWPCDMPEIMEVAGRHGIRVIEDCAQAHGARIDGRPVGSFGDVAAFSFCEDKIMSTGGEGGMLLTNDDAVWSLAWSLKDHGKSWERVNDNDHPVGFRWLHERIGSNWRMTEIQGAIGRVQLHKLDDWVRIRRSNADRLRENLGDLALLRSPEPNDREYHAYYKFYAFVRPNGRRAGWSRDRMLAEMQAEGVPGLSGSCPEIYREKAFAKLDHNVMAVAQELGETSIMFLVHPTLLESDLDRMIATVRKVCRAATR